MTEDSKIIIQKTVHIVLLAIYASRILFCLTSKTLSMNMNEEFIRVVSRCGYKIVLWQTHWAKAYFTWWNFCYFVRWQPRQDDQDIFTQTFLRIESTYAGRTNALPNSKNLMYHHAPSVNLLTPKITNKSFKFLAYLSKN